MTTTKTMINEDIVITEEHISFAKKCMDYIDASPDPFHVVLTSSNMLLEAGFEKLEDNVPYTGKIVPGGKYFFSRNNSTLVAFCVGGKYESSDKGGGFKIVGAHTDSPNLKVKPRSKRSGGASGTLQLGAECYGGGLWHTWFDRDLGISGRVFVKNGDGNKVEQKFVKIMDRALLRISTLCIHLQTAEERAAFKVNKEEHLSPILASEVEKALNGNNTISGKKDNEKDDEPATKKAKKNGWTEHQEPMLLQLLAKKLKVAVEDIMDFELNLCDIQKSNFGGIHSEFMNAARLDNLASCFIGLEAIMHHASSEKFKEENDISMVVLYDHEEVGSESAVGAASPVMRDSVRAISWALNDSMTNKEDLYKSIISKSFVISCDQAHALHPNYAGKHEKNHAPKMNHGMVLKKNENQRYASTTLTSLLLRQVVEEYNHAAVVAKNDDETLLPPISPPLQEFIVRQDCGCGTTIGPIISTNTGIRTVDVGMPSLSMHSIRECMGVYDLTHGVEIFKAFFEYFNKVDSSVEQ